MMAMQNISVVTTMIPTFSLCQSEPIGVINLSL